MADHGNVEFAVATGNDYEEHEKTYENFLAMIKWSTIGLVALLVLMAIFLL